MEMTSVVLSMLTCAVLTGSPGPAEGEAVPPGLDQLAVWPGPGRAGAKDWLIDGSGYKAGVFRGPRPHELVLTNGLIARTFRMAPNAATVGLDNLVTGEAVLRGVKPEATIELDGRRYEVGGLKGQPNCAFLRPEWVDQLRADSAAFRLIGFEVGEPNERFAWKRVRHHAPNAKWPPDGTSLRLDFAWPLGGMGEGMPSAAGRSLLWDEGFSRLDPAWKIIASRRAGRISFQNEGKAGEIYALAGTHCYAERGLPAEVSLVEAVISPGTDQDTSWGPGLGLVFPGRVVEVNLRPGDRGVHGQFELRDNGGEQLAKVKAFTAGDGGLDTARKYRLRVRLDTDVMVWEVADAGQDKPEFHRLFEVSGAGAAPRAARVGKTDRSGGAGDEVHPDAEWSRCRIERVRVFGPFDAAKAQAETGIGPRNVTVSVHYELYDGLPCYSKWLTVRNGTDKPVRLDRFSSEILAVVERVAEVDELTDGRVTPNMHVETDMAFGGMMAGGANRRSCRWLPDPAFHTQVNYEKKTPCLLDVGPDLGPAQDIAPGRTFESLRTWILPFDSYDRERCGLSVRRMYRVIAPWITENPLMMHVRSADEATVARAIEQCAETGFEMIILSFGSGFDLENEDSAVLARARRYAERARNKGLEIGSYSLLASRQVGGGNDVAMPPGQRPTFGNSPCLESRWGQRYFARLYGFHRDSGFTLLEHDGSYPGDVCQSDQHPGHRGLADSRWNQWRTISSFYQWCRGQGLYLNVPDHYFLVGSNKTGMGYRETNWSLPREQQVIHTRQNIYDGTWEKTPSMGWMFVPLTEYQGGGAAATIEPLDEHLDHYERMLYSNLALGVQACYRGPRLYDTERTKAMVKCWVDWYKAHRDILESDLVHGRRADARDLDWMLHVNPGLKEKGLLVVFNPLDRPVTRTLRVNLYYTGLTGTARVAERTGEARSFSLDREYAIDLPVNVPAQGMSWYVVE
ncbi:MAG TPA: hypothetical protein PKY77_22270 [Phycisphaerae bacterium]|nr:hypothetical protein [Phycisphaerae bacterium]HRY68299.1 hypothetical protein [Phycisphaerae bacterium]HSA26818.1 hypothetical protein [Phycisphaerae bacterium]